MKLLRPVNMAQAKVGDKDITETRHEVVKDVHLDVLVHHLWSNDWGGPMKFIHPDDRDG